MLQWIRGISFRMVCIFLLLILFSMMVIGVYLHWSMNNYYEAQYSTMTQQTLSTYISQARTYFMQERELQELKSQLAEAEGAAAENLSRRVSALNSQFEVTQRSFQSFINPNSEFASSSRDQFQVAIFDCDYQIIHSSAGISPIAQQLDVSLLETALLTGQYRNQSYRDPRDAETELRIDIVPIMDAEEGEALGLVYQESSAHDLNENLSNLSTMLVFATVGALLFTSILAAILANTITRPIVQLTRRAQTMAQGDYSTLMEVNNRDEVGRLAESFNTLTVRLKETMDEIADEKGKVEAMLHYMAEGVIAVSETGDVIHINPSAQRMFRLQEEHKGTPINDVLGGLEQQLGWRRALLKDEMVSSDLTLAREQANLVLRAHSAPFVTADAEKPSGVVIVLTDVSEQERLEEERRDFLANVSHELRTPLTTVKSYVETLLDGAVQSEELAERFLSIVLQETDRMSRLVSELLQMAQQEAPARPESLVIQDLRYIMLSVERKMLPQFQEKRQQFLVDICDEEAMVLAPQDRIEQLCVNLLTNACKYTPEGGTISLRLLSNASGSDIIIADDGIGIPAEHLPHIFERFYRVDKARSRDQGGTGLGLAIVKQIIDKLGGSIQIESEAGKGTTISVWMPKPEQFAIWGGEHRA